jgi:hypothetical protein
VFYRLLKENYRFYVEVLILDEKYKFLLVQSSTLRSSPGEPRSSAQDSHNQAQIGQGSNTREHLSGKGKPHARVRSKCAIEYTRPTWQRILVLLKL